jgi:hypothetical protein
VMKLSLLLSAIMSGSLLGFSTTHFTYIEVARRAQLRKQDKGLAQIQGEDIEGRGREERVDTAKADVAVY